MKESWTWLLVLLILGGFLWSACSQTDDEAAVRALIDEAARLGEAHDVQGVLGLATHDLKVTPGDLDRRAAKGALWRAFKYYGSFRILYPRASVEVDPEDDRASARLPFLIVRKGQDYPALDRLPEDPLAWIEKVGEFADLYRLQLELSKEDGDWMVGLAKFERFTGYGFDE
jgi:hypothetical protein